MQGASLLPTHPRHHCGKSAASRPSLLPPGQWPSTPATSLPRSMPTHTRTHTPSLQPSGLSPSPQRRSREEERSSSCGVSVCRAGPLRNRSWSVCRPTIRFWACLSTSPPFKARVGGPRPQGLFEAAALNEHTVLRLDVKRISQKGQRSPRRLTQTGTACADAATATPCLEPLPSIFSPQGGPKEPCQAQPG